MSRRSGTPSHQTAQRGSYPVCTGTIGTELPGTAVVVGAGSVIGFGATVVVGDGLFGDEESVVVVVGAAVVVVVGAAVVVVVGAAVVVVV